MGAGVNVQNQTQKTTRVIPTVGMRGGLGRTLLTAFLFLSIVPLVLIGGYAAQQNKNNIAAEAAAKLSAIATLKGETLLQSLDELETVVISPLVLNPDANHNVYDTWWLLIQEQIPGLQGAIIQSSSNNIIWFTGECSIGAGYTERIRSANPTSKKLQLAFNKTQPFGLISVPHAGQNFVLCFNQSTLNYLILFGIDISESGWVSLVVDNQLWPSGERFFFDAESSDTNQSGLYEDASGTRYFAAYYALPWDGLGVQVAQAETEVMNSTDQITATLILLILAVALGTTGIAAAVVKQITRPVIHLTESALVMAEGDLDQHLEVKSHDEIGILTYVFNEMAADLKSLYADLEAKVVERTKRLQSANYQIQRRALHLQASQEVSQAITSVRNPDLLLTQVVDLIRDRFVYSAVAIYIIPPLGGAAQLKAVSPRESDMRTIDTSDYRIWPDIFYRGDGSVVDQAMHTGDIQIDRKESPGQVEWYQRVCCRVAIPLKMEDQIVGVIGVDTAALDGVQEDEIEVLELLGNQVTIALENARVYERERLAIEQLEAAEAFKSRFLGNMSHELREPLNTVIGFSRLLLKGVEGPLNPQQNEDIEQIYNDSQHLLFLINDILSISQIQAGLMELKLQAVKLSNIVEGVLPTANALIRGKEIELIQQIPENLPALCADPNRLRQIIIHLLNNAAKYTNHGWIKIRAWQQETNVYISLIDTGIGISIKDRERIFTQFERGDHSARVETGAGLGLALCKEFVALHGGKIWVDSEVNVGSTFTFFIPVYTEECDALIPQDEVYRLG